MPTIQEVFEDKLQPDPRVALQPCPIPVRRRSGPMPRLQFVIEFVGPRSISAPTAAHLLHPDWMAALGDPQAFAMSAADVEWQPLTQKSAGSYDSLAVAWDLVSAKGQLSKPSAEHLLKVAEQFAEHVQRRAMPMPVPDDLPKAISMIKQVKANFDAGVSLLVLPDRHAVSEYELWIWCAQLGLTPRLAEGSFQWLVPSSELPLFEVSPLSDSEMFTLEGAARGDQAQGVLLGFNIPRSPEPVAGFDGMMQAARALAEKMAGKIYDDSNRPMRDGEVQAMRAQVAQAVEAMTQLGFAPGSAESLILFGEEE